MANKAIPKSASFAVLSAAWLVPLSIVLCIPQAFCQADEPEVSNGLRAVNDWRAAEGIDPAEGAAEVTGAEYSAWVPGNRRGKKRARGWRVPNPARKSRFRNQSAEYSFENYRGKFSQFERWAPVLPPTPVPTRKPVLVPDF